MHTEIHSKNLVSILHLLVTLARHFKAPIRLPENVSVNVFIVTVMQCFYSIYLLSLVYLSVKDFFIFNFNLTL